MEPHGFLSGKCKHGSSNFCTLCDIEGHPERYTEKLLLEVVDEIIEAARVPLSSEVGVRIMVWYTAKHRTQQTGLEPDAEIESQANDAYERAKVYFTPRRQCNTLDK
jgi:hypothetical protein